MPPGLAVSRLGTGIVGAETSAGGREADMRLALVVVCNLVAGTGSRLDTAAGIVVRAWSVAVRREEIAIRWEEGGESLSRRRCSTLMVAEARKVAPDPEETGKGGGGIREEAAGAGVLGLGAGAMVDERARAG